MAEQTKYLGKYRAAKCESVWQRFYLENSRDAMLDLRRKFCDCDGQSMAGDRFASPPNKYSRNVVHQGALRANRLRAHCW